MPDNIKSLNLGYNYLMKIPGPSCSITLRIETINKHGMFGKVATAIGNVGGDIGAVDIVSVSKGVIIRDITVNARDETHEKQIVESTKKVEGLKVIHVSDMTFLMHHGGKIGIHNKVPIRNRNDLSMVYTPCVARVCTAIQHDKEKSYRFTIKKNSVAIITDGSAVLGLGDIRPEAAMPVIDEKDLSEDYIIPSIFDRRVVAEVTSKVSEAAYNTMMSRRNK